jgi:hypothetical protein
MSQQVWLSQIGVGRLLRRPLRGVERGAPARPRGFDSIMPGLEHEVLTAERYYFDPETILDPISGERPGKLRYGVQGVWKGIQEHALHAVLRPLHRRRDRARSAGFPARALHTGDEARPGTLSDEGATHLLAQENGKKWDEAMGMSSRSLKWRSSPAARPR